MKSQRDRALLAACGLLALGLHGCAPKAVTDRSNVDPAAENSPVRTPGRPDARTAGATNTPMMPADPGGATDVPESAAKPDAGRGTGTTSPTDAAAGPQPTASDARPSDGSTALPAPPADIAYLQKVVPVLWITVGKVIPLDLKVSGTIKVISDHDGTLVGIENQPASLAMPIGIEIRGSSSARFPQTAFGIELRDNAGEGAAAKLLGLPPESDFVLHSCYTDKTCLRNALTYAIGSEIGRAAGRWWAPRTRWVEVFIDGDYRGLYLLVEKIKRDKNRVALPKPAPDAATGDLTGGYIYSFEGSETYRIKKQFPDQLRTNFLWQYRSPNYLEITPAQKIYLQGAVAGLEKKLLAKPLWADATKVLDAATFIDYVVMQEVANNTDSYFKSWYFYKQSDANGGLFFTGPLWDFDIAWGNINYGKNYCTDNRHLDWVDHPVFRPVVADPLFRNATRCRFNELRANGGPLDVAAIEATLDAFTKHIEKAKARDQKKWGNIGKYISPNNYVGATWKDEVSYLKYWIRRRIGWLDKNFFGTCSTVPAATAPRPLVPPAPATEATARGRNCCGGATAYIPLEGPVDPAQAAFACP